MLVRFRTFPSRHKWAFSQMTTTVPHGKAIRKWVSAQLETWKGLIKEAGCICNHNPHPTPALSVVWVLKVPMTFTPHNLLANQWPSTRGESAPRLATQEHLPCLSGDIFGCHYLGDTWATSIVSPETRDAPTSYHMQGGPPKKKWSGLKGQYASDLRNPGCGPQASKALQAFLFCRLYSKWPLEVRSEPHK